MRGHGAGDDAVAQSLFAGADVKNNRGFAAVDHLSEFGNGNAIHSKLSDEGLSLDPACGKIECQCAGNDDNAVFAQLGESHEERIDRIVEEATERNWEGDKEGG